MNPFVQFDEKRCIDGKNGEAVKNGEADACVSAGNTGALMAAGLFIVGRIDGIDRPALLQRYQQ